ncbi:ribonucleoside hydrolase [Nakamurella sp. YIM 132087]|uniref:Ribonucleoside hydrolase n=1 Tax=Nakamurella alba TaxID=2665158 RepID=A0A7K1FGI2_9ACTN|nr:nucleoside hydrolase [Nakamurella alba]MTD13212.1 ribonucleoside hydrolase [Nakamurella alba]
MATTIILDCDPGHDDAFAMLTAYGHPAIDLVAVTTVCGNQTVDLVTRNALAVGGLAGMTDVLFARGAEHPLVREHRAAPDIHGDTGLDGPPLPDPGAVTLDPRSADQLIVDLVMAAEPGEITLVATAPLTNLALALQREPLIAERVEGVAIMGGAVGQGNITPSAEFNILVDPEAAAAVFDAGWSVTMMGLEVSHQALATPEIRSRIAGLGTDIGVFADQMLEFFQARYLEHQGFESAPVHDLCPVVGLIDPTIFEFVRGPIAVETAGRLTDGRTVVDLRLPAGDDCRHRAGVGLDFDRFWDVVIDALSRLG